MTASNTYIGNELELFSHAINWKSYYKSKLLPFIAGDVLEAGAGIGETTLHLLNDRVSSWLCLEPDAALLDHIQRKIADGRIPSTCMPMLGTSNDLLPQVKNDGTVDDTFPGRFDCILYIDVIEHIADDHNELIRAKRLLRKGGRLIILVPAHQWLYSPFDKAIGHYRRYDKKMLRQAVPAGFRQEKLMYLDCVGLSASLANKLILKKDYPTLKQVQFWDKTIVPVSKLIDPLLGYSLGKTLVGVWTKQ